MSVIFPYLYFFFFSFITIEAINYGVFDTHFKLEIFLMKLLIKLIKMITEVFVYCWYL